MGGGKEERRGGRKVNGWKERRWREINLKKNRHNRTGKENGTNGGWKGSKEKEGGRKMAWRKGEKEREKKWR